MTNLATLISTCPATISDASGIASAITWLAACGTFADASEIAVVPNKSMVKSYAYAYWESIKSDSTDYASANSYCQHVKALLQGDVTVT